MQGQPYPHQMDGHVRGCTSSPFKSMTRHPPAQNIPDESRYNLLEHVILTRLIPRNARLALAILPALGLLSAWSLVSDPSSSGTPIVGWLPIC
jgi:hypothetical protein